MTANSESRSRKLVMPEAGPVLDAFGAALNASGVAELRAAMDALVASLPPPDLTGIAIEEHRIDGPSGAGPLRILLYRPTEASGPLPVHLDIHGGGFVAGSAETDTAICLAMCRAVGSAIVSVDYRLAPETRHPGALDDCAAAFDWIVAHAGSRGFDLSRLTIGGESAGGGYAAALAICLRDRGGVQPILQVLGQPMLDDRTCVAEPNLFAGEYVWTPDLNRIGWESVLGVVPGSADVPTAAVPARARNLHGLPPALVVVGALDLFVDEAIDYARRLIRSGVSTELHVLPGLFHGAASLVPQAALSGAYFDVQHSAMRRAYATAA